MHTDTPLSWGDTLLAILPGVFALGSEVGLWQRLLQIAPVWDNWVLLCLCTLLCGVGFIHERRFPIWSFPALGIMLALVSMGAGSSLPLLIVWLGMVAVTIAGWRCSRVSGVRWEAWLLGLLLVGCVLSLLAVNPDLEPLTPYQRALSILTAPVSLLTMIGVLPAVIGLMLVRRANVLAGLVFVGSAFVTWEMIGDPEYALMMWTDNRAIETLVSLHPQLFFLVIVPVIVVRLQTVKARIAGFLLPTAMACLSADTLGSMIRPYDSLVHRIVFDFVLILLPLAIVIVMYARASRVSHTQPSFTGT